MMGIPCDFVVNPYDVNNRNNEQYEIREQTDSWECVSSSDFFEENQLKELTYKEHKVKVAKNLNQDESVVNDVHTILVFVFNIPNFFK